MKCKYLLTILLLTLPVSTAFAEGPLYVNSEKVFVPGQEATFEIQYAGPKEVEVNTFAVLDPPGFFLQSSSSRASGGLDISRINIEGTSLRDDLDLAISESEAKEKPKIYGTNYKNLSRKSSFRFVKTEKIKLAGKEEWNKQTVALPSKDAGLYLVEVVDENRVAYTTVSVSKIALITKRTTDETLFFVADRESGEPVKGAKVLLVIFIGCKVRQVTVVATDESGIAVVKVPYAPSLLAAAARDADFTIADSQYHPAQAAGLKCYAYTERPVYRPAEKIYFKGIIRQFEDGKYSLPQIDRVSYEILDASGASVAKGECALTRFFTFSGEALVSAEPRLGTWKLVITVGEKKFASEFSVQEYRKPEFKVTVMPGKSHYLTGDEITATVTGEYFFGGPVSGGKVQYSVKRCRFERSLWERAEFDWYFSEEEFRAFEAAEVAHGKGVLDAEGKFTLKLPADKLDYNYTCTISATVTDKSGIPVSGAASVKVTTAEFSLDIKTDKFLYKLEDSVRITVKAVNFAGEPVSTKVKLTTRIIGENDQILAPAEYELQTDQKGEAEQLIGAGQRGKIEIEATCADSKGNKVTATKTAWVTEGVADLSYSGDWIEIIPDKKSYSIGETARILVLAPMKTSFRLITVEGDRILKYEVLPALTGNSTVIELPIKEEYSPNFFFCVSIFYKNQLLTAQKVIIVPPKNRFINVKISSSKDSYRPREEGEVSITTTDNSGKPVSVELSLSCVDESLYYISPELAPGIREFFYPLKRNNVGSCSSLLFHSFSRAEVTARLPAPPKKEGPSVQFGEEEEESGVTGGAPSAEGAPPGRGEPQTLSARRALGAESERDSAEDMPEARQEMYRKMVATAVARLAPAEMRKEFATTILWQPHIVTDQNGFATLKLKYADNLANWRFTARAISTDSCVGDSTSFTKTRKNVVARLALPRFLRERDILDVVVIGHNYLGYEKQMTLQLSASGVEVERRPEFTGLVKNQDSIDATWNVRANRPQEATFSASALTDTESDALEIKIPVLPHGIVKTVSHNGILEDGEEEFVLNLPESAIPESAQLQIVLSPSIQTAIVQALKYLIEYPHGCTEQTMSRFLPAVIALKTLRDLGLRAQAYEAQLPSVMLAGLERLYRLQHSDGGWGWWEQDVSHPFMTGYVVYGLATAQEADVAVDGRALALGISQLRRFALDKSLDFTTRAYVLFALSAARQDVSKLTDEVFDSPSRLTADPYTQALLLYVLARAQRPEDVKVLEKELLAKVQRPAQGQALWGEGKTPRWQSDSVETTAFCIKGLLAAGSQAPEVKQAVTYLLSQRGGDRWKSTLDTSCAVFALSDYLISVKAAAEVKGKIAASVRGEPLAEIEVNSDNLISDSFSILCDWKSLAVGENTVKLAASGKISLSYSASISYFTKEEPVSAASSGFAVKRDYYSLAKVKEGDEFVYKPSPLAEAKKGDLIMVETTVTSEKDHEFFILTDNLPAGAECVVPDEALKVSGVKTRFEPTHREFHDEKVVFFATNLSKGEKTFRYFFTLTNTGVFHAMPAVAELMYFPQISGNSDEKVITVR